MKTGIHKASKSPQQSPRRLHCVNHSSLLQFDSEEEELKTSIVEDKSFFDNPTNSKLSSQSQVVKRKPDKIDRRHMTNADEIGVICEKGQESNGSFPVKKSPSEERLHSSLRKDDSFSRIEGRGNRIVKTRKNDYSASTRRREAFRAQDMWKRDGKEDPSKLKSLGASLRNDDLMERFLAFSSKRAASFPTGSKEFAAFSRREFNPYYSCISYAQQSLISVPAGESVNYANDSWMMAIFCDMPLLPHTRCQEVEEIQHRADPTSEILPRTSSTIPSRPFPDFVPVLFSVFETVSMFPNVRTEASTGDPPYPRVDP
eukprot:scaffold1136_cov146-Cylindrotheca_fusiformis.AAC.7